MNPHKPVYRAEIDGLRAFAVLSVVFFHAFPSWLKGGFIGVDIFFVISGFLITSHIFEKLDQGTFSFSDFFGRRIRRIFPALAIVMLASLGFGWFVLFTDEYAQLGKHVASGAAFILNFVLVDESGYFDNAASTKPMMHLWSLAVEEQFYIIWPLVLWASWKGKLNLLAITLIVAFISLFLNITLVNSKPSEAFFLPIGRFWELLSGSLLAWFVLYKSEVIGRWVLFIDKSLVRVVHSKEIVADGTTVANLASIFGLLLLSFGVIRINEELEFPGKWALIPIIGAVLVISAASKSWINRIILMNPLAVWLGLISYPLYLWHWPIFSFLLIIEGEPLHLYTRIFAIILSFLLAWLTYMFVEMRIRKGEYLFEKTLVSAAIVLALCLVGTFLYKTDARALPSSSKQLVLDTAVSSPKRKDCHFGRVEKSLNRKPCVYFGIEPNVAVFGNSHSVELAYAVAEELKSYKQGIVHHTMSGCRHNYGLKETQPDKIVCVEWHSAVMKSLKENNKIQTVIVSYRNEEYLDEPGYRSSLVSMLSELSEIKRRVILVLQAPLPKWHIKSHIRKSTFSSDQMVYGRSLENWRSIYSASDKLIDELPSNVLVFDPANFFCYKNLQCLVIKDGKALFFDDDHISVNGARLISGAIVGMIGFDG